jgi:AsmA protein
MTDELAEQETPHSYRWLLVLALLALVVVGALVVPPLVNANRLRGRLVSSLSGALGRPVRLENVSLRLLPRPGLAFDNLEVAEDPKFGAEPVMRASNVVVGLRLLPLWRGQMEVATISLNEASVNLARNPDGHWNFESVLERTSQLPARLPTGPRRTSAGQRFPYLSVTNGRVNFKRGAEKLPFSFTDAEFSLWLETPQEWRVRFRATPVRTDLDASYTGEFRVEGSIQRAAAGAGLSGSGLSIHGEWVRAPLGQLTRMIEGTDRGWRGLTNADFILNGTAAEASVTARVQVDGLRRDDFVPSRTLPLDVNCIGKVAPLRRVIENAACVLPTGAGRVRVIGESAGGIGGLTTANGRDFHAQLVLEQVPAEWALDVLRVSRQHVSPQLVAGGELNGSFTYDPAAPDGKHAEDRLRGDTEWTHGTLNAPSMQAPVVLPAVRVDAGGAAAEASKPASSKAGRGHTKLAAHKTPVLALPRTPLVLEPVALDLGPALGDTQPLLLSGGFSRAGYAVEMDGVAELGRATELLRQLGLAHWNVLRQVSGKATSHVLIEDVWMHSADSSAATVRGTVSLEGVVTDTAWIPGAVTLSRADITFAPDAVKWQQLQWTWAGAKFDGSAQKLAKCEDAAECAWRIVAHTSALNAAAIQEAFSPSDTERVLQYFRDSRREGWPEIQIDLTADALALGPLTVKHANAGMTALGSQVKITRLTGEVAGGVLEGSGLVALDAGKTELQLGIARVNLAEVGAAFHEKWGRGTAEASTSLTLHGGKNVSGSFTAMLREGGLPGTPLERFDSWQMAGTIGDGHIALDRSVAGVGATTEKVSGTIGFDRSLDLTVVPGTATGAASPGKPIHIGGTLAAPVTQ